MFWRTLLLLDGVAHCYWPSCPHYIIPPAIRIRDLGEDSYPYLPPVQCMAYAHGLEPARDLAMD